jgi:hypothetical protein
MMEVKRMPEMTKDSRHMIFTQNAACTVRADCTEGTNYSFCLDSQRKYHKNYARSTNGFGKYFHRKIFHCL